MTRIVPNRLKLGGTYNARFEALCAEASKVEVEIHAAKPPKGARRQWLYEQRDDIWRRLAELEALVAAESRGALPSEKGSR